MKPDPRFDLPPRTLQAERLRNAERAYKQAAWHEFWRVVRTILAAFCVVAFIILAINYPGQALALFTIGGALLVLIVGEYFSRPPTNPPQL